MTKQLTPPSHMGLPPPAQWTLIDAGRVVGWTTDSTRSIPIDVADALTIRRDGEREAIFAGRPAIASLVRPRAHDSAADAPASESFAFEIELPQPADELRARAMAHLMYRALRKSGLRWTLWRSGADTVSTAPSAAAQHSSLVTPAANDTDQTTPRVTRQRRPQLRSRLASAWREQERTSGWATLVLASVVLLLLSVVVPPRIGIAFAIAGFAGLAALRVAAPPRRWTGRGRARAPSNRGARLSREADAWDDYRNAGSCA